MEYLVLIAIGSIAGILTSLYGLGGGLTIVPALLYCLPLFDVSNLVIMQVAVGTSLAIMFINNLYSLLTHAVTKNVKWRLVYTLLPYIILGTVIGALVAHYISANVLLLLFILLQLIIIIRFIAKLKNKRNDQIQILKKGSRKSASLVNCFYGILTGIIAACFGGGASLIMLPYLKSIGLLIKEAAAVVVAFNIFIGLTATIIYSLLKTNAVALPHYSTGYIFWPAFGLICIGSFIGVPVGTFIVHKLAERTVTNTFIFILLIIFIFTFTKFITLMK